MHILRQVTIVRPYMLFGISTAPSLCLLVTCSVACRSFANTVMSWSRSARQHQDKMLQLNAYNVSRGSASENILELQSSTKKQKQSEIVVGSCAWETSVGLIRIVGLLYKQVKPLKCEEIYVERAGSRCNRPCRCSLMLLKDFIFCRL